MEKNVQKTDCDQCWCLGASPEAEHLDMEIWRLSGGRKVFAYSDYIYGNVLQFLLTSLKGVLVVCEQCGILALTTAGKSERPTCGSARC